MDVTINQLLRALPKVDECLELLENSAWADAPYRIVKAAVQEVIEQERRAVLESKQRELPSPQGWLNLFEARIRKKLQPNFTRVINGTGVIIHTNLGRSLLSETTTGRLAQAASYYSNLEFDLATGKRGSRYSLVEQLLCELTGAEAALVVNNNAAAVMIALETVAKGKEVIVSRGQLVEIGGSFRIPDVMAKSGATLVEVGATNRTHLRDYRQAITAETAMLLRVHTSNFKMIGFTSEVSPEEMVALARESKLVTMEDLGSGCLVDLSPYGFPKEPTVQEVVAAGVDLVTFSGDKLLGGPQAGIIVGRAEAIAMIKRNPLNRALRIDKFTLSALESVLREYYDLEGALQNIPTLAMMTASPQTVKRRAQRLQRQLQKALGDKCAIQLVQTKSRVGGGALPEHPIDSWALALAPQGFGVSELERGLRGMDLPVIGRIEEDRFLLDARTLQDKELSELAAVLACFFA